MTNNRNARFLFPLVIVALSLACMPSFAGQILSQPKKLFAGDGAISDGFGFSADMSGDSAVISTFRGNDSVPGDEDSGWVYVFRRDNFGFWQESSKLIAMDAPLGNGFGFSVAISGDSVIVGAVNDNDIGWQAGAAYIFQRDGADNWHQVAKLFASDASAANEFGDSVDISGNTAIVGSSRLAYLFRQNDDGNWIEIDRLLGDDSIGQSWGSVAISGNTAVIGNPGGDRSGAAYVFREDATGNWNQVAKLSANDGASDNSFGESLAIHERTVIVGGETGRDPETSRRSATAYIFHEDDAGIWQNQLSFITGGPTDERADKGVAISGDLAVVGLPRDDLGNPDRFGLLDYGSAYIFSRKGNAWSQVAHLRPNELDLQQYFGMAVAVDSDLLLIGAYGDNGAVPNSGAAYLYRVIPEPSALLLATIPFAAFASVRWRRRKSVLGC